MCEIKVWTEELHRGDWGSEFASLVTEGHEFSVVPWHQDNGEEGTMFRCSCGFFSVEEYGCGTNKDAVVLDATHAALLLLIAQEARRVNVGYPALWEGWEKLALEATRRTDGYLLAVWKFLVRLPGAPTIAELRKMLRRALPATEQQVYVTCIRYPTPKGVVEISPRNPIPKGQQKATAAHTFGCPHCAELITVVTKDPLGRELEIGFDGYTFFEGHCPYCADEISLEEWGGPDEITPNSNFEAISFVMRIPLREAQALGLLIMQNDGYCTADMPLYYG